MLKNNFKKLCETIVWENGVEKCVEICVENVGGKVYSVQYTVYNVQ